MLIRPVPMASGSAGACDTKEPDALREFTVPAPATCRAVANAPATALCGLVALLVSPLLGCSSYNAITMPAPAPTVTVNIEPRWANMSQRIAYTHIAQDSLELLRGRYQVWVYDFPRDSSCFITAGSQPEWAPDDRSIAYVRDGLAYIHNLPTHSDSLVFSCGLAFWPSFSSSGSLLALDASCAAPQRIWLIDLTSGQHTNLPLKNARQPRWSPTDSVLAHSQYRSDIGTDIYLMTGTGMPLSRLTNSPTDKRDIAWSHSGEKIAWYSVPQDSPNPELAGGIWTMNADGTNKALLNSRGASPTWSPDDTAIAFVASDADGVIDIWTMSSSGGNPRRLIGSDE